MTFKLISNELSADVFRETFEDLLSWANVFQIFVAKGDIFFEFFCQFFWEIIVHEQYKFH